MRYALFLLAFVSSTAFAQTDTINVSDTPFGAANPAQAPAVQSAVSGVDMGLSKLFNEADTNHDNAVSREEFMAKANQQFGMGDTNKDGKITRDEMQAHQNSIVQNMLKGSGNWQQKIQGFLGGAAPVSNATGVTAPTAPTVAAPTAPTAPRTY